MIKQIIESIPTEQSQVWAFSRHMLTGLAGILFGIGILTAAQQGELLEHATTIIDSAQRIMIELGKIALAVTALAGMGSAAFSSFKAGFKQQVETVAENTKKTEAVVLKDEKLASEIPSPKVIPASAVPIEITPPQAEFTP
jgi:hypothetical protein